jgi:hypothetical protein
VIRSISHRFSCVLSIVFAFTFLNSQASTLCLRVFFCNVSYFYFLLKTSSKLLSILYGCHPVMCNTKHTTLIQSNTTQI